MTENGCLNCKNRNICCCLCQYCRRKWKQKQFILQTLKNASSEDTQLLNNLLQDLLIQKVEFEEEANRNKRFFSCCQQTTYQMETRTNRHSVELPVGSERINKHYLSRTYQLKTRGRICKYYLSTLCCCFRCTCWDTWLKSYRFNLYHNRCYSCIPTALGTKEVIKDNSLLNGITFKEYATLYEKHHQFNLDEADISLLRYLTVNQLFCQYCYRPLDPKTLNDYLLTPFWALCEIISIYSFLLLYVPLFIIYGMLTLIEMLQACLYEEKKREYVDDYDGQYVKTRCLNVKKNNGNKYML
eukprot:54948_1